MGLFASSAMMSEESDVAYERAFAKTPWLPKMGKDMIHPRDVTQEAWDIADKLFDRIAEAVDYEAAQYIIAQEIMAIKAGEKMLWQELIKDVEGQLECALYASDDR